MIKKDGFTFTYVKCYFNNNLDTSDGGWKNTRKLFPFVTTETFLANPV